MLRRSLFVSALMLAGVVGFASSAKAETASVPFSGAITSSCAFTAIQARNLSFEYCR
jgi:hypothetical protein